MKHFTFSLPIGPDPDFPYLKEKDHYTFRNPKEWGGSIIEVGGNLSPGMLLSAYEQGIFPWYNPEDPILWQSPDPRCLIFPETLHISASMQKVFNKKVFDITFDKDFIGVITSCAKTKRPGQEGTWITGDIVSGYMELHRLGYAHSAEAWHEGELAGGCYGVILGKAFFGESMFSKKTNASKAAFLQLAKTLFKNGLVFIDCQVPTHHLLSLGGEVISRQSFLELLMIHRISRRQERVGIF